MAKYTIELRNVAKLLGEEEVKSWFMNYNLSDFLTSDEIEVINNRGTWTKEKLANKIFNHYYMREIGFETPKLFEHYVKTFMNELMESKLPLIYSASIEYDPLVNVDYQETLQRSLQGESESEETGNNTNNITNNGTNLNVINKTPQGQISLNAILSNGTYASDVEANKNDASSESEAESTINRNDTSSSSENYTKRVKGNSGVSATAQKMIEQYRDNIRSIDKDIIDELNILFMQLY